MNKSWIYKGLVAVVLFQMLVLAGVFITAFHPLWTGTEIKLRTVPIDPRSLFRGHYARLRYDISTIPKSDIDSSGVARENDIVYICLRSGDDGIYEYCGASFEKPASGMFLRGRLHYPRTRLDAQKYNVRYGIEALFTPQEKAANLEKQLRNGGIAIVKIAKNGKAALKNVLVE
ncbi:MAG: hypothetical protein DWQ10_03365 [Calditrichaeota bacterium]|nr:MAG: hypothetical protein DWQ10_03365 [Calditrichota bacterium]